MFISGSLGNECCDRTLHPTWEVVELEDRPFDPVTEAHIFASIANIRSLIAVANAALDKSDHRVHCIRRISDKIIATLRLSNNTFFIGRPRLRFTILNRYECLMYNLSNPLCAPSISSNTRRRFISSSRRLITKLMEV